jgi:hypothetical protein
MSCIVQTTPSHEEFRRCIPLAALEEHLGDEEIEAICSDLGHTWRVRQLPPGLTVRSCVHRALNPDHSIARVLASLAAFGDPDTPAPTDSAWCQARCRVPEELFGELIARKARTCRRRFGQAYQWNGRWVFIADGSTVSMPDQPALAETFGYADTKHGPSRFPLARVTFLELAGLEVIWDYRIGEYRCSEDQQFQQMWPSLPNGCICLLDRKFSSFYVLSKLRQRDIGVVTRLHQRRDPQALIRDGRRLGPNEWIVPLTLSPQLRREYADPSLPKVLRVRLIRVRFGRGRKFKTVWLVTTLMDPITYPRRDIAAAYRRRWGIEPRIGSLKTTLEMDVLRSKSPQALRREVASIILGHNLVWMLIHEAAEQGGVAAEDISFAGAVKVVGEFSPILALTAGPRRQRLRRKMLEQIARQRNHHPFNRVEPRRVKRDPVRYPFLRKPRWEARLECLS